MVRDRDAGRPARARYLIAGMFNFVGNPASVGVPIAIGQPAK